MLDALELLKIRRSVKPREMSGPGPSPAELETILTVGARVPDHGKLTPWRFIVFEGDATLKDGTVDHSQVGLCWQIGKGKMFYFQAGHETNPVFQDVNVRKIIANAVLWATPQGPARQ